MAKKRKNFIREKRIYCGEEYLEVDIVAVTNMPEAGKGKRGKSSQAQKNLNDKRSKRRFVQIANTNFGTNDFHISATYNNEHLPMSLEEAEKNVHNYLDRIKRKMKRETGEDLKYMLVTEYTPEEEEGQLTLQGIDTDDKTIHQEKTGEEKQKGGQALKQLTLGSLFDGIGGFCYAAGIPSGIDTRCTIKPLWTAEVEPNCIDITRYRFKDVMHVGSVTELKGDEVQPVDIITFGSPCQDLSIAGKRKGLKGNRSGLFTHAIRIIREMRLATNGKYPTFNRKP